jgi:Ssp1 endopeptidase immunity protein Rap1a
MKVHRAILVVLLASMVGGAAIAASTSSNPNSVTRMYGFCRSTNLSFMSRCATYIHGFSTMMTMVGQASADPSLPPERRDALRAYGMCSQELVSVAEMMRAFVNWTERNPQAWESNGEVGVLASLREAWPCT